MASWADWQCVHVFVSSTFRDMHPERDYLQRFVFPALRERCAARRLHLIGLDLRWGVTADEAERGDALALCLQEIELRHPVFLGLLGDRYGYRPAPGEVPEALQRIPSFATHGASITEVEFRYAMLLHRKDPHRNLFYHRSLEWAEDVSDGVREVFWDAAEESRTRLEALRRDLDAQYSVREYTLRVSGQETGSGLQIEGLEVFGERVLEDLWKAIAELYPRPSTRMSPLEQESFFHERFIASRTRVFVGRDALLQRLEDTLQQPPQGPVLITGEAGAGKSALMAAFAERCMRAHPECITLAHFIGVSPGSTTIRRLLRRLCQELVRQAELAFEVPDELGQLLVVFPRILEAASAVRPLALIIDGVDLMDSARGAEEFLWLPERLPANCRIYLTAAPGPALDAFSRVFARDATWKIGPLNTLDAEQLVQQYLRQYAKKLGRGSGVSESRGAEGLPTLCADEMQLLLGKADAGNPLYLIIACEELVLHGEFETLATRIHDLPGTVPQLLQEVLRRLEEQHGEAFVRRVLSLIALSSKGLQENDLLQLTVSSGETDASAQRWVRLYRSMHFLLQPTGENEEDFVAFFHRALHDAVCVRYLGDDAYCAESRRAILGHFRKRAERDGSEWSTNMPGVLREVAHQAESLGESGPLSDLARDKRFLEALKDALPCDPDIAHNLVVRAYRLAAAADDPRAMTHCLMGLGALPLMGRGKDIIKAFAADGLEAAWAFADQGAGPEEVVVDHLVLAALLNLEGLPDEARLTLERLDRQEHPCAHEWMEELIFLLLRELIDVSPEMITSLSLRLLSEHLGEMANAMAQSVNDSERELDAPTFASRLSLTQGILEAMPRPRQSAFRFCRELAVYEHRMGTSGDRDRWLTMALTAIHNLPADAYLNRYIMMAQLAEDSAKAGRDDLPLLLPQWALWQFRRFDCESNRILYLHSPEILRRVDAQLAELEAMHRRLVKASEDMADEVFLALSKDLSEAADAPPFGEMLPLYDADRQILSCFLASIELQVKGGRPQDALKSLAAYREWAIMLDGDTWPQKYEGLKAASLFSQLEQTAVADHILAHLEEASYKENPFLESRIMNGLDVAVGLWRAAHGDRAEALAGYCAAAIERLESPFDRMTALLKLAAYHCAAGREEEADDCLEHATALASEENDVCGRAFAFQRMAGVLMQAGLVEKSGGAATRACEEIASAAESFPQLSTRGDMLWRIALDVLRVLKALGRPRDALLLCQTMIGSSGMLGAEEPRSLAQRDILTIALQRGLGREAESRIHIIQDSDFCASVVREAIRHLAKQGYWQEGLEVLRRNPVNQYLSCEAKFRLACAMKNQHADGAWRVHARQAAADLEALDRGQRTALAKDNLASLVTLEMWTEAVGGIWQKDERWSEIDMAPVHYTRLAYALDSTTPRLGEAFWMLAVQSDEQLRSDFIRHDVARSLNRYSKDPSPCESRSTFCTKWFLDARSPRPSDSASRYFESMGDFNCKFAGLHYSDRDSRLFMLAGGMAETGRMHAALQHVESMDSGLARIDALCFLARSQWMRERFAHSCTESSASDTALRRLMSTSWIKRERKRLVCAGTSDDFWECSFLSDGWEDLWAEAMCILFTDLTEVADRSRLTELIAGLEGWKHNAALEGFAHTLLLEGRSAAAADAVTRSLNDLPGWMELVGNSFTLVDEGNSDLLELRQLSSRARIASLAAAVGLADRAAQAFEEIKAQLHNTENELLRMEAGAELLRRLFGAGSTREVVALFDELCAASREQSIEDLDFSNALLLEALTRAEQWIPAFQLSEKVPEYPLLNAARARLWLEAFVAGEYSVVAAMAHWIRPTDAWMRALAMAAVVAAARGDCDYASRLVESLESCPVEGLEPQERFTHALLVAQATTALPERPAYESTLSAAKVAYEQIMDPATKAAAANCLATVSHLLGMVEDAEDARREALHHGALAEDPSARVRLLCETALLTAVWGQPEQAKQLFSEARAGIMQLPWQEARASARIMAAQAAALAGLTDEALRYFDEIFERREDLAFVLASMFAAHGDAKAVRRIAEAATSSLDSAYSMIRLVGMSTGEHVLEVFDALEEWREMWDVARSAS